MAEVIPVYARRIVQFRRARKLSQARLAELMAVEQPTVQRWENGKRDISASKILLLAVALNVPPHALFVDDSLAEQFI